jgi:hypothetical protein
MASSTRSAGSSNSDPGISRKFLRPEASGSDHSRQTQRSFSTRPSAPRNSFVDTLQDRSHPSSWAVEVRRTLGQVGHGFVGTRSSGGFWRISICTIDFAPCRRLVPMQSDPVSPPPMTTTFFPAAVIPSSGKGSPPIRMFCWVRNSIAKWTPERFRPGTGRSLGTVAPVARRRASKVLRRYRTEMSVPALTPVSKTTPSARICSSRRSMIHFSSL